MAKGSRSDAVPGYLGPLPSRRRGRVKLESSYAGRNGQACRGDPLSTIASRHCMKSAESLVRYDHYIDGARVAPAGGEYLPTENPYTGKAWALDRARQRADAEAAVEAAQRAFVAGAWPALTPSERGRLLWRLGDLVDRQRGAPGRDRAARQRQARRRGRRRRSATWATTSATTRVSPTRSQSAVIPTDKKGVFAYTRYEPKGVVAIITPWNSPLTLTSWKLAPALAAGCTAVIKPSEFTSASMLELAQLVHRGGLSERRRQRRHRPRPRGRRGAGHAPGGRAHRLHRRRRGGPQDLRARGAALQDGDARARRQVAQHRLRRRRPRPGGEGRRLRHLRGLGPELPGRLAPAGAARRSTTASSPS